MERKIKEQKCHAKMNPYVPPDHCSMSAEAVAFDAFGNPARKESDCPCAQTNKP